MSHHSSVAKHAGFAIVVTALVVSSAPAEAKHKPACESVLYPPAETSDQTAASLTKTLTGEVSATGAAEPAADSASTHSDEHHQQDLPAAQFGSLLTTFLQSCYQSDAEYQKLDTAVQGYSLKRAYIKSRANDALNSIFMFKGVSVSSQAGDVILDEKMKINSLGAAKYARQKLQDDIELRTTQSFLQVAMALGTRDPSKSAQQLAEAREELVKLGGSDAAEKVIATLTTLCTSNVYQPGNAQNWSIATAQDRIRKAIQTAAVKDPIVEDIKHDVHHYNHHSQVTMAAHRMVRVALSVTSLAPNIYGPASQALLFGYVVLSGGSEQSKVMKELYMGKRLSSRAGLLAEEAHLVFHNYQLGAATNNLPLVACSQILLERMIGSEGATALLGDDASAIEKFAAAGATN